jgi:putative transposase
MARKGHTEEEILRVLREAESGETLVEVCRKHGISQQSFYLWKKKYAGLGLSELRELRQLREENGVTRVLDQIIAERGPPRAIRCDNGPELTSRHFLAWALDRRVDLVHIRPGKPTWRVSTARCARSAYASAGSRTCSKPGGSSPPGVAITTNGGLIAA